ncbi:MAG: hypothetical protein A3I10_07695 [Deltaproteobacteria bacterium RIFCSPLOWO2_02_FULL_57_26]|nr:MAG: hypothetical protein A3I10_07695 [Deltaproteobacteria bacterium RIFCSPLOWO2_02_FULL_57_26]
MPDRVGRHAPWVVIFVKASEALVPELPDDHDGLYGITVHPLSDFQNRKAATWRTFIFCASVRPTRVANGLWGIGGQRTNLIG